MTPAVYALQLALNGWIGVSDWQIGPKGWVRIVFRCRRVDGSWAARIEGAPKA